MMRRRSIISYVLLLVCMIMLTASVIPHHHHQEMVCLQHDLTECACPCSNSSSHSHENEMADEHHSCSSSCVTRFSSVTPHDIFATFAPDYSFVAILFSVHDILELSLYSTARINKNEYYYLEHLHSTALCQSVGLRAPPYSVI